MKVLKANDGSLTNFEVLDYLRSRGASKEVAITVAPSEYKVFEYLVETAACNQTRENVIDFVEKAKKYNLSKAEVLNVINIRPSLPVGVYTIVEKCDVRLGETGAEELAELVAETLPPPPTQPESQDVEESETVADGDPKQTDEPEDGKAEAEIREAPEDGDDKAEDTNLVDTN